MEHEISPRFLRLKHIIGDYKANPPILPIIPIAKSTWWDGVKKVSILNLIRLEVTPLFGDLMKYKS